jgi:hypothetical protein
MRRCRSASSEWQGKVGAAHVMCASSACQFCYRMTMALSGTGFGDRRDGCANRPRQNSTVQISRSMRRVKNRRCHKRSPMRQYVSSVGVCREAQRYAKPIRGTSFGGASGTSSADTTRGSCCRSQESSASLHGLRNRARCQFPQRVAKEFLRLVVRTAPPCQLEIPERPVVALERGAQYCGRSAGRPSWGGYCWGGYSLTSAMARNRQSARSAAGSRNRVLEKTGAYI